MAKLGNVSLVEAKNYAKAYREANKDASNIPLEFTPFHFVPNNFLEKMSGVPGVDGVKIYKGLKNNKEILILVPAFIKNKDKADEEWVDIFQYAFKRNDGEEEIIEDTIFELSAALGPCPPPPAKTVKNGLNG
jgi:hypothetical protein